MKTSYSALDTYKTCPLKYKYSQIEGRKEPKRIEQVFGTLIHSALKYMFERNPLYPTLDEVIDFYTKKWAEKSEKIEWRNPEKKDAEEKMYFEEGIKIIKNFYKKNQPWTFNVVELEGRFSLELEDDVTGKVHTLSGIIDRIDKDPESDVYEIIDYKTGKKMPAQKDVEENLQLGLYHLALSVRWPQVDAKNIKTSLYFLKHNEKIGASPTKETVQKTKLHILETIREIEERIENDNFPPLPGPLCGYCGFRQICPMWAHEYKIKEEKTPTEEELASYIGEYFEIKKVDEEHKKKIAELRKYILHYMEDSGVNRVFGDNGYITKTTSERFAFDVEKAKPFLEKIGRWNDILVPDAKKIEKIFQKLLPDEKVELEGLRKKTTVTTLKQTAKRNGSLEEDD